MIIPEYINQGIGQKLIKYLTDAYNEPMTIGVRAENDMLNN